MFKVFVTLFCLIAATQQANALVDIVDKDPVVDVKFVSNQNGHVSYIGTRKSTLDELGMKPNQEITIAEYKKIIEAEERKGE